MDIVMRNEGTVTAFEVCTDDAREWVKANVELADYQWLGDRVFVVESRYVADLVLGMREAGLRMTHT